jgi:hypothetical protein
VRDDRAGSDNLRTQGRQGRRLWYTASRMRNTLLDLAVSCKLLPRLLFRSHSHFLFGFVTYHDACVVSGDQKGASNGVGE